MWRYVNGRSLALLITVAAALLSLDAVFFDMIYRMLR